MYVIPEKDRYIDYSKNQGRQRGDYSLREDFISKNVIFTSHILSINVPVFQVAVLPDLYPGCNSKLYIAT